MNNRRFSRRLFRSSTILSMVGWGVTSGIVWAVLNSGLSANQTGGKQGQQRQKLSEEAFKNIQVLKGIPQGQFIEGMRFMAASLGVFCDHCHVTSSQGNWPMEKDDKEAKRTARKMILMMRAINDANFGGRPEVTCATCHQGHVDPRNVPPIEPLTTASGAVSARFSDQGLPTADEVLNHYVAALGGRAALDKISSREIKGTLLGESGRTYPLAIHQKAPNKYRASIQHPDGEELHGFNGSVGWGHFPGNLWTLEGSEFERIARAAEFWSDLDFKSRYPRLKVTGKDSIGGHEVYVLVGSGSQGTEEKLYFDCGTRLLLSRVLLTRTPLGRLPQQTEFEDYRDVDGVKVPFVIRRMEVNARWTEKYSEVRQNVETDDRQFDPPPEK